eukprot:UN01140
MPDAKSLELMKKEATFRPKWYSVCMPSLLHAADGKVISLNTGTKVFVDRIANRKAYLSQPSVGWCNIISRKGKKFCKVWRKLNIQYGRKSKPLVMTRRRELKNNRKKVQNESQKKSTKKFKTKTDTRRICKETVWFLNVSVASQ